MRELLYGQAAVPCEKGTVLHCVYEILIHTAPPPLCCESYGIRVSIPETGERSETAHITVRPERIEELAGLLLRGQVTPCAVGDVIADWL